MKLIARLLRQWLSRFPVRTRDLARTVVFGIAGALAAVAFHLAIHELYGATLERFAEHSRIYFLLSSFLVMIPSSLVSGWLLTSFCRDAAGSGIPQLKLAFWKDFGNVSWRVVWVKFIAGALSVGGGSSLGREGPSVHLAGGLAANLAGAMGEAKQARRPAAAAGAAAGLAAAFNTPLAAVTFVLEEIIEDLNSRLLGRVLLAGVVGALVVHAILGKQPAFAIGFIDAPTWKTYLLIPLVAAGSAAVGGIFQRLSLDLRRAAGRNRVTSSWAGPAIGACFAWALGCVVFFHTGHLGVFSLGYTDLSTVLNGQLAWQIAAELLLAKVLATAFCYGFGGCGGIFSPTLFFGGMAGAVVAGIAGQLMVLTPADQMSLSIVGMVASLAAVVRAPVTGILIVFEMTHELSLIPALMIAVVVSEAVARLMNRESFYATVLRQNGVELERVIPPRDLRGWQLLPVTAIASFKPVIAMPENLRELLDQYPYRRFPFVENDKLKGVATRAAIEQALATGTAPALEPASICLPHEPVRELQMKLINSSTQLLVLMDAKQETVLGVLTLHDLLRAQTTVAESAA